jgi:hypothetical protein
MMKVQSQSQLSKPEAEDLFMPLSEIETESIYGGGWAWEVAKYVGGNLLWENKEEIAQATVQMGKDFVGGVKNLVELPVRKYNDSLRKTFL